MEFIVAERLAFHLEVPMPGADILAKGVDQVVKDFDRDVVDK